MKLKFENWVDFHHQIYRIYHGIIALTLVPFFLLFLEIEVSRPSQSGSWLTYLLLLVLIPSCGYLSWMVWKSEVFQYKDSEGLREKLEEFRRVEVRKYLTLELVCLLGLLGLWLTAHYLFIITYFAVLVQFSFLRPSEERVVRVMRLSAEERNLLRADRI